MRKVSNKGVDVEGEKDHEEEEDEDDALAEDQNEMMSDS